MQQRALAAAGGTKESDELAVLDSQVHVLESKHGVASIESIRFADTMDLNLGHRSGDGPLEAVHENAVLPAQPLLHGRQIDSEQNAVFHHHPAIDDDCPHIGAD